MTAALSDCLRAPVWDDVCCKIPFNSCSCYVSLSFSSSSVPCHQPSRRPGLRWAVAGPEEGGEGSLARPGDSPSLSAQRGPPPTFPEQGTRQDREGWSPQEGSELCLPRARLTDTDLRAALCTLDVVCSGRWGLRHAAGSRGKIWVLLQP